MKILRKILNFSLASVLFISSCDSSQNISLTSDSEISYAHKTESRILKFEVEEIDSLSRYNALREVLGDSPSIKYTGKEPLPPSLENHISLMPAPPAPNPVPNPAPAGAVGYRPVVGWIPSGSVLDVQATASADRRYVNMNIKPQTSVNIGAR